MNRKEAATEFESLRKRGRNLYLAYGIGLVCALFLMLFKKTKPALAMFLLLLIGYFMFVRPVIKTYSNKWREYCIRKFADAHFSPVEYSYTGKPADVPELRSHLMLPMNDKGDKGGLLVRNVTKCGHPKMKAAIMDVTVPMTSSGKNIFYSGGWIGLTFDTGMDELVRTVKGAIMPGGSYAAFLAEEGLKPCDMGDQMNPDICVCTASGHCTLDKEVVACLRRLMNVPNQEAVVDIDRDGVYVYLPHRLINRLPPSFKVTITEDLLDQVSFPELDEAYLLALTLYNGCHKSESKEA